MSIIQTTFNSKIFLELTEGEAAALAAVCGYGPSEFIAWFYRNLGKHYLQPHQQHIKTLFDKARKLDTAIKQIDKARQQITTINIS